jgi:HK97 family phage portal protein
MGRLLGGKSRAERAISYWGISGPGDLIPRRTAGPGFSSPYISTEDAMRNSAVWAALRIRADLISTLPLNIYRDVTLEPGIPSVQIDAEPFGVLNSEEFAAFKYSSQIELDRTGNSVGIIREVFKGYPSVIDLQASANCHPTVDQDNQITKWRIKDKFYTPDEIWHEKQYTISGSPLGLSPVANAAYTMGLYRSVEDFVTSWFMSGQTPRARLKNVNRELDAKEALIVKEAWRASQSMGEPFVHGSDWEYDLVQAQEASADWLSAMRMGAVDIARFFSVPANIIDANVSGQSVTYANLTARSLDFLVFHLQPAIERREEAWSQLIPLPRYVELDTDALLRMDPITRAQWIKEQIDARILSPNEGRAFENRKPFTQDQIDEFEKLGLNKTATGALTGEANLPVPFGTQTEPGPPAAAPGSAPPAEPDKSKTPPDKNKGSK